ncbi:MAG: DinB family protein [Ignavibacteria bacterium]|nr:DinB family protein [Ignavibacteria bacterium]
MDMKQSEVLVESFESVRNLTKFYLSKVKPEDIYSNLFINEIKYNSPFWIASHLAWSENFLILIATGGKPFDFKWLDEFGFGSKPEDIKSDIKYDEVINTLDQIHKRAMEHILSLSDEKLNEKNLINANFGGKDSKKSVIIHAIRHEPMHAGQLSWILKAKGISMV